MARYLIILLVVLSVRGAAQISTSRAHAHNDYEQHEPFWAAWKQGFGSIEADVFLEEGELVVAHDKKQLSRRWTLDSLYLQPLAKCIAVHNGNVYADSSRQLQLMIDIKSEAAPALKKLVEKLALFPLLTTCKTLRIVISGNRPDPSSFKEWPQWIRFDAVFQKEYNNEELERVDMFSDNFARYSAWKGDGDIAQQEEQAIAKLVAKAHTLNKKIRFWNAPDNLNSWKIFLKLGVDYINTDRIDELSRFLETARQ